MVDLALLFHMHQPMYRDPRSGEFLLPWVRLHASRAYYDVVRALEAHPGCRVHINFVPALLDQLELYAAGVARDRFLDLTERPAADLEPHEREFVWAQFFMVDWETEVRRLSRYHELLLKRGTDLEQVDLPRFAREAPLDDLRDLQVLFNLAWTGFALRDEDPALRELLARGRGFREQDKAPVLGAQRRAAQAIVPAYGALASRGQVELTTTPYYHPILPLLIDTESARPGLPSNRLPPRFAHPDDARLQVARALESHTVRFGATPTGMWPAEGSVSEAAAEVFAAAGVKWIASDEGILLRSLGTEDRRSIQKPYRLETAAGPLDLVFRDRGLSDLIGFTYSKLPAAQAVEDFCGHLRAMGEAAAGGAERPLVSVVLDGENPWEHYPESGREFLHTLFAALEAPDSPARTVRFDGVLSERTPEPLARLHPGSWIDANFRIWIGHAEDVRAWEALGKVRGELVAAQGHLADARLRAAHEAILVAEGSDWFWWYGEDFSTENAAEFDALFRGYLALACAELGVLPPPEIAEPISARARLRGLRPLDDLHLPTAFVSPAIDGRESFFGEWNGAGFLHAPRGRGAMAQSPLPIDSLRFGFDPRHLYLRLDPGSAADGLGRAEILVDLGTARGSRSLRLEPTAAAAVWVDGAGVFGVCALHDMLEASLPLPELGVSAGETLELAIRVRRGAVEVQRLPLQGTLSLSVPGLDFERVHWKV